MVMNLRVDLFVVTSPTTSATAAAAEPPSTLVLISYRRLRAHVANKDKLSSKYDDSAAEERHCSNVLHLRGDVAKIEFYLLNVCGAEKSIVLQGEGKLPILAGNVPLPLHRGFANDNSLKIRNLATEIK
ncbi:hypothetical protein SASPL_155046 [Salvia splendens]|uniref:Uncharacterized protein n=1 Tax=Salvia splendens TaxID=180675 RepID=A0A8X8W168_SALSN|nr:hypothetical protein SASPL_155046 [Salvia splendens]